MSSLPLTSRALAALAFGALTLTALPAWAESHDHDHEHAHDEAHEHDHGHAHDADSKRIYSGYFTDEEIQPRSLSDWHGDWQSVYPLLQDGTLAPVMAAKAQNGDKTAEDYTAYYDTGYATDVDRIEIAGNSFTFHGPEGAVTADYINNGYEVLTYAKGNRGVRYIFRKVEGDDAAPGYVQFSDHAVSPTDAGHYHLYWGDDRAALLEEVTNWPTYYPADLSGDEIVEEMLAH